LRSCNLVNFTCRSVYTVSVCLYVGACGRSADRARAMEAVYSVWWWLWVIDTVNIWQSTQADCVNVRSVSAVSVFSSCCYYYYHYYYYRWGQ